MLLPVSNCADHCENKGVVPREEEKPKGRRKNRKKQRQRDTGSGAADVEVTGVGTRGTNAARDQGGIAKIQRVNDSILK